MHATPQLPHMLRFVCEIPSPTYGDVASDPRNNAIGPRAYFQKQFALMRPIDVQIVTINRSKFPLIYRALVRA